MTQNTVSLLRKLVSFNSVAPNELEIGKFLSKTLQDMGFSVILQEVEKDRFNVLAEKGEGPAVMLYGHMDVVEVGEGWTYDPFDLKVEGDIVYGRGVHDMKGGIVSILEAVDGLDPKNIKIKVAFGVDEEQISSGSNVLANSGWLSDVKFAIVPESNATSKYDGNIGLPLIVLGRRGRVPISIKVHGKAAHAAKPENGINAITDAVRIVEAINSMPIISNEKMGSGSVCVLSINSSAKSLTVPEDCEILVDRHYVPPETETQAVNQIKGIISSLGLKSNVIVEPIKRPTPFLIPYMTDEHHPYVEKLAEFVKEKYGRVEYGYGMSVADENCFGGRLGIPTVVIGPKGGNPHSVDEWASISSIEEVAALYRRFLQWLG
ncbi:MAG: M20 family metallopeptidase [Candidatus Micrarchaeia archaeon]